MQRPYLRPSDQTQESVEKFLRNGMILSGVEHWEK